MGTGGDSLFGLPSDKEEMEENLDIKELISETLNELNEKIEITKKCLDLSDDKNTQYYLMKLEILMEVKNGFERNLKKVR